MISLLRLRLPFLGLLLAAIAGIMIAGFVNWPSVIFGLASLGLLGCAFSRGRIPWILFSVAFAFASVHIWQTRESTSHKLGGMLRDERISVIAAGRVISNPVPYGRSKERFILHVERMEMEGKELRPSAPVAVVIEGPAPARGDQVSVVGGIQRIPPPRNPAEFDAKAWMEQRGITCEMEVSSPRDLTVLKGASKYSLFSIASRSSEWMERTLRIGISGDPVICDLLAGMVLGVTASIPDPLQQEFRNTGTFHLFSVSGLHVGMIALILWQALKIAGIRRRWAVAVIIPALFFYALLTGWKSSSLRAAVMSSIFLIGMTSSHRAIPFNSLCAAAFLILIQWTNELFNPGFQLSFLVVAAILLLAVPLHERIRRHCHPDPFIPRQLWTKWQARWSESAEAAGGLASVSIAAWVGSFPLTLFYFHMVSFSALPANLVIVPLAFVIMATAVLALIGGVFWSVLPAIFNNANWLFCKLLLVIVHCGASLPGSFVYVGSPSAAPATVTVFDFGAGGGAAVECGRKIWLLDCGSKWHLDSIIVPWLHSRGKATPEGLLLTHGDARHIGAASELISRDTPGLIVESALDDRSPHRGQLHKSLDALGIPKSLHRAGDQVRISQSATMRVLYPPSGILRDTADDKALVVRLDAGSARILFLSDSGPPTLEWLMQNAAPELRADIVIKGMHRSGISMDTAFVDAVRPKMIVTTASHFPENEPVNEEWIRLMEARGIRVFRQDLSGAVTIKLYPSHFEATGFFDGVRFSSPEG